MFVSKSKDIEKNMLKNVVIKQEKIMLAAIGQHPPFGSNENG